MRWVAAMSGERVSGGDSGDSGRRSDITGRRRWLVGIRGILFAIYLFSGCIFVVSALPLALGWPGGMPDRLVPRVAVLVQGLIGVVLALTLGVAGKALVMQDERHREMMGEEIVTVGGAGGRGGQIVEGEGDAGGGGGIGEGE